MPKLCRSCSLSSSESIDRQQTSYLWEGDGCHQIPTQNALCRPGVCDVWLAEMFGYDIQWDSSTQPVASVSVVVGHVAEVELKRLDGPVAG